MALLRLAKDWGERLGPDVIAIDGKTLQRSFENAAKRSPLHVVNAFATGARLTLGPIKVDGNSNEIMAMPVLLELLDIKGSTITVDAMHTQRATAETITSKGGAYVLALKGNQKTLHEDVRHCLAEPDNADKIFHFNDMDKGHGRIETREATVYHDVNRLVDLHNWPGLKAVGKVTCSREIKGKQRTKTRFFLLSECLGPEQFLKTVRSHCAVENSLHWVLDVTIGEDSLRNRKNNGPENLALMRKLALNLARATPTAKKQSMRGKLKRAGWYNDFLLKLVSFSSSLAKDVKTPKIQTR